MRTRETCQGRDASHRPPSSVVSQWVRKNLAATVPFYAGTIFGRTIFAHGYKISILGTKIKQKRGRVWSTLKKYYSGIFATSVPVVQITTRDVNKFCASSSKVFLLLFCTRVSFQWIVQNFVTCILLSNIKTWLGQRRRRRHLWKTRAKIATWNIMPQLTTATTTIAISPSYTNNSRA